jgi:predicted metal-dependent phosphoesterase TrpH/glycosyltransferase involved in cell wall biosynthesis
VGLRICLVTPFSWSQPHEVNEHVRGVGDELRRLGHTVTVVAPSGRAADLLAGRRALARGLDNAEVVALAPAVPISRRSSVGVPVGVRANLALALRQGAFDVVHGFEPGLPSLSYQALRDAETLAAATFFSADRLVYPPRRTRRRLLLGRVDALLATSQPTASAAADLFPGDYRLISPGVDLERFRPGQKRRLAVVELQTGELALARATLRALRDLPDWELLFLRTKRLSSRPAIPKLLRSRVHVRTARDATVRAAVLAEAAVVLPAPGGLARIPLEAAASGCAVAMPPGVAEQPELGAAALARLAEDEALREREGTRGRAEAELQSFPRVAAELDELYRDLATRRRPRRRATDSDPLAGRDWIVVDLHMHTTWSHDCSIEVPELVDHAEAEGLGAIAVTDHNAFGGALEALELARGRDLVVIPGEEVKTDGQGEVIGLFLQEEIPRGLSFTDTIAAIREQGGLVYLPHPFDRLHAIPDPATLHRHLAEIDVLEVYNARLLFEAYNDEAVRFARKYGVVAGAGSDAHVLQGVGTGAVRMRRFDGPEDFLLSLRTAEVLRRPKSLAYLQGLKWVAQVKEKVR